VLPIWRTKSPRVRYRTPTQPWWHHVARHWSWMPGPPPTVQDHQSKRWRVAQDGWMRAASAKLGSQVVSVLGGLTQGRRLWPTVDLAVVASHGPDSHPGREEDR
jgi:hypothetical protein